MEASNIRVAHILNRWSETASAIDQLSYSSKLYKVHSTLIVGPSVMNDKGPPLVSEKYRVITLENDIFSLKGFFELYRTIKRENLDLVHLHHSRSGLVALICGLLQRKPVLLENGAARNNYRFATRVLFTFIEVLSTHVVYVSKSVKDSVSFLERFFVNSRKVSVIYYGVDIPESSGIERNDFRRRYNLAESDIVFSHSGRFVPVKNQVKILRLFAHLNKTIPSKLVLAGDGPLKEELERLVKQLELDSQVIFTGLLPREDIYTLLSVSNYFVMLSKTEGHSVSLLEAMASSCVPILSDIPSFRETISAKNAVFVSQSMSEPLIDWRSIRQIRSIEVRHEYERRYSKDKMMMEYFDVYERILRPLTC